VKTEEGKQITYEYLVVATGIELKMNEIKGLKEAIGKNGVTTNYLYEYVNKTWEFLKDFKGGTLVFTVPEGVVKCGGAPQKIMWLADDYLRKQGLRYANYYYYYL
jgi:sulfide:quinone oxidoreductase